MTDNPGMVSSASYDRSARIAPGPAAGPAPAVLILCLLALAASPARSLAGPGSYGTLRLRGMLTAPLGENTVEAWNDCGDGGWFDYLAFRGLLESNVSGGASASFEYVFSGRYGLEASFIYWYDILDIRFETEGFTAEGSPNFILPTIGANYHLVNDERKDIYAGASVTLGVLATGVAFDMDVSKDVALGLNLGMDYRLDERWSIGGSLKYIDFGEIDFSLLPSWLEGVVCDNGLVGFGHLNTVTVSFGAGYRF